MYTENRKATVTSKYSYKGLQPLNGKMMFMDFPVRRPVYYVLTLSSGDEINVTKEEYIETSVGDSIQYDHQIWETNDYIVAAVITVLVIGAILLFFSTI